MARKATRPARQAQPLGKDVQPSEEVVLLAPERLRLPDEDSQTRSAILVSQTLAKDEREVRTQENRELTAALILSRANFLAAEDEEKEGERQLNEALAASLAAAAQAELSSLEAQLQDALHASQLSARAAAEMQTILSSPCAESEGFEERLALALADVQATLRETAGDQSNPEPCHTQESKHAAEAAGPARFDMVVAGIAQVTLHPTMLVGGENGPDSAAGPDALDHWWGGEGSGCATLEFAGSVSGNTCMISEYVPSECGNTIGSIGGA